MSRYSFCIYYGGHPLLNGHCHVVEICSCHRQPWHEHTLIQEILFKKIVGVTGSHAWSILKGKPLAVLAICILSKTPTACQRRPPTISGIEASF